MTAQPIAGLGSDDILACNTIQTLSIKEPAEAQKDEEGEGRDFSCSLAQSYWSPIEHLSLEQLETSQVP